MYLKKNSKILNYNYSKRSCYISFFFHCYKFVFFFHFFIVFFFFTVPYHHFFLLSTLFFMQTLLVFLTFLAAVLEVKSNFVPLSFTASYYHFTNSIIKRLSCRVDFGRQGWGSWLRIRCIVGLPYSTLSLYL